MIETSENTENGTDVPNEKIEKEEEIEENPEVIPETPEVFQEGDVKEMVRELESEEEESRIKFEPDELITDFCVLCGKPGNTVDDLCRDCLLDQRLLLEVTSKDTRLGLLGRLLERILKDVPGRDIPQKMKLIRL